MIEASNPPGNRIPQRRYVSFLVTLELIPSFDIPDWPSHIHLDGPASAICWGLLEGMLENKRYVSVDFRRVKQWHAAMELPEDSPLDGRFEVHPGT